MQTHNGGLGVIQEQQGHLRKAIHAMKQDIEKRQINIAEQLDKVMMMNMIASMDVAEFHSPPKGRRNGGQNGP